MKLLPRHPVGRRVRWLVATGLVLLVAGALAACGDDDEGSGSSSSSQGNGQELEKLKVATSGPQAVFASAFLPELTGIAKEEGLDVTVEVAGINLNTTMASGGADIALSSPVAAVAPAREGLDTSVLFSNLSADSVAFVVGNEGVSSIDQCTKMSTTTEGTTAYGNATLFQSLFDLDYDLVTVGDAPAQTAALVGGSANCGVGVYDIWAPGIAEDQYQLILDPRKEGELPDGYPTKASGQVYWGLASKLEEKKSAIDKYMRALTRVYDEVLDTKSPEEIVDILQKDPRLKEQPKDALVASLEVAQEFDAPDGGRIDEETWTETVDFLKAAGLAFIDPSDSTWSYEERVNMSYLDQASK